MSTTDDAGDARKPPRRWQVSLADLIIFVLAAGVSAGIARGSRDIWGKRLIATGTSGVVPVERTVGVVLEVLAVLLIFTLARAVLGLGRRGRSDSEPRIGRVRSRQWHAVAIALLMMFVAAETDILRLDYLTVTSIPMWRSGWEPIYKVRESLFPICGLLGMLGLTLGMGAGAFLDGPKTRRPRPYWLFVPLATLVGLLIVAQPSWLSLIPQVVLIAIEAVSNGMRHILVGRPSLSARLLRGGIEAGLAGLSCLTLALIVAHDFERARRHEPWATRQLGWILRLFWLLTTTAAGTYVGVVTIRAIEPHLANGFRNELGPVELSMLLGGFGLFAAGLAARSVGGRPDRERPRRLVRLSTGVRLAVLILVLLAALKYLPSSTQFDVDVPGNVGLLVDVVGAIHARLWGWLPDPLVTEVQEWLGMDRLVWILPLLGLMILLLEIILAPNSQHPPPFRVATGSPAMSGRFIWLTVALAVVCLAAVPIFIVAGQALVHLQLRGADFRTLGWPRLY